MPENNDNIDNNLDEQIDDINIFDDFESGDPDTQSRKPAGAKRVITKNLLSATSAFTKTAANEVANSMPKTGGLVGEFIDIKDSLDDFRKEFRENYAPTINEVKKAMYKSLPMAEKYIPRALYSKIENALKDYKDEVQRAQKSEAQQQSDYITKSIAEIFAAQEEIRSGERTEDRVNDIVEKVTEATRHEATKKLLTNISNNLHYQSQFTKTTQTAWMKKMLELKYISVYTGREMLSTMKIQVSMLETKLEELKHNNAIPDWNKWTKGDLYRKVKRDVLVGKAMQAAPGIKNYISTVGKGLIGTAKQGATGVLRGIKSQASLLGTAADMQGMMPEDQSSVGTTTGKVIGGLGGRFFGRTLADRLLPLIETIEDEASSIKDTAFFKAKRAKERLEGKGSVGASILASFLPTMTESMDVENELLKDPTQPLPFDRATRQAIVEIIPAYLAKIAKNTRDTATGRDTEEQVYDVVTRQIVGKTKAMESAKSEVFGKAGARSQESMVAVGQIGAGLQRNVGTVEAEEVFKAREQDIFKFINNSAIRNEIVYPEMIRRFAEGDEEAAKSIYIRKTFQGIENPKAVAQLISMSLYDANGKVDRKVLRKIETAMINASSAKTWRDRLPQMLEAHGGYGMFKESGILSEESVVSEAKLSSMLSEVTPEQLREQIEQTSRLTTSELKLREEREAKLRETVATAKGKLGRKTQIEAMGPLGVLARKREELRDVGGAFSTAHLIRAQREGSPLIQYGQRGVGGTIYADKLMDISRRAPMGGMQGADLGGIREELQRFHRIKESSDIEMLKQMADYYTYRKDMDSKTIDAFTDTDQSVGPLGRHDIFEKMQLDLETLTATTVESSMEMMKRLDNIIANAEVSLRMAGDRTLSLNKLADITDRRMPKKVFGDTDADNIREGSYADQMKERATGKMKMAYGIPGASMFIGGQRPQGPQGPQGNAPGAPVSAGKWGWVPGAAVATGGLTLGAKASGLLRGALGLLPKGAIKEGGRLAQYSKLGLRGMAKSKIGNLFTKFIGSGAGKATGAGLKGVGGFGSKFLKAGLAPIIAAAEFGLGARKTIGNVEESERQASEIEEYQDVLKGSMFDNALTRSLAAGGGGLAKAFNLDKSYSELMRGNVFKAGWESTKGVLGSAGKAGELVGSDVTMGMETIEELKGDPEIRGVLNYLKDQGSIKDPFGWGYWQILDWNAIKKLRSSQIVKLVGSNKFSPDDEKQLTIFAKFAKRRENNKAEDMRKIVEPVGTKPQPTITTTDASGRTVAATYQAPAPPSISSVEMVDGAKREIEVQTQTAVLRKQAAATEKTIELLERIARSNDSVNANTGELGEIKKDISETNKAIKEPKVVIANTGEGNNKRPKVHQQSVNVRQGDYK